MTYIDKVVVVTGAGEGIGRSIALHYAKEGAKVVVADKDERLGRESVDLIYDQNGSSIFLQADVTCESDVKLLMENVIHCYNKIDVLVNNVGMSYHKNMLDMTLEEWDNVINVNLRSVFLCSREAGKYMKAVNSGAIVNIASSKSFMNEPDMEAYAAAKGGIVSMTLSMAASFKKYNIQVNCISPGYIETTGYERLSTLDHNEEFTFEIVCTDDIAKACTHLTLEGNEFLNGSNLIIDKGLIRKMIYLNKMHIN